MTRNIYIIILDSQLLIQQGDQNIIILDSQLLIQGDQNCRNMTKFSKSKRKQKPFSKTQDELDQVEDRTEVFALEDVDCQQSSIKGLQPDFSHLIRDLDDEERVANPSERLHAAYTERRTAKEAAKKAIEEESKVQNELIEEIKRLEAQQKAHAEAEDRALDDYRQKTNAVMCLEMEEPCRWNDTYKRLKMYIKTHGELPPAPSFCTKEADRKLSIWIREMVSLKFSGGGAKSRHNRLTMAPHRIEALEALGVEWIETGEDHWNKMYDRLLAYKRDHKTVRLPSFMQCHKSKDTQLAALRRWVELQAQEVRSGAMAQRRDRLKKLQAAGLPVKLGWEHEWSHFIVELLKFRSNHGHLKVFGNSSPDLVQFVTEVLNRLRKDSPVNLSKDELNELRSNGLLRDLRRMSRRPVEGSHSSGSQAESVSLIPLKRVKEVNYWVGMVEQLKAYKAKHGSLDFHDLKKSGEGGRAEYSDLFDWVEIQREDFARNMLEQCRITELRKLGFEFDLWDQNFHKLKRYKREAGTVRLPKEWKRDAGTIRSPKEFDDGNVDPESDKELDHLCKWVQEQIRLYRKDQLDVDKKKKLRKLGIYLTKGHMGKTSWEERFEEMMNYYHTHKTCLPTRDGECKAALGDIEPLLVTFYNALFHAS